MSDSRFADGLRYRIEIPSVEGPGGAPRGRSRRPTAANVPVRRVSQGSGVMMLTDAEIADMARLGARARGRGLALPRAARGAGTRAASRFATGARRGCRARRRPASTGASRRCARASRSASARSSWPTSVSWPTLGQHAAGRRAARRRSSSKTSVLLPCANPATARALEELGASTINVATDLSAADLGELRAACSAPLDVYVEVPDDQGGFVRFYEAPQMIRVAAALYVKLGVRNAPEHLSGRVPPRGRRRQACAGARTPCRARAAVARASRRPSFSKAAVTTGPPTSGSLCPRSRSRADPPRARPRERTPRTPRLRVPSSGRATCS